jgi:hypothetical protein
MVIEESNKGDGTLIGSVPGMLLSPLGDLSHTSILYYLADTIVQDTF